MVLRKAAAYSTKYARPHTRHSKKRAKSYIKTIPPQKISNFRMGSVNDFNAGKFKLIIRFMSGQQVQIRDNAIEASRQFVHKVLETNIPGQYYFEVKIYPHHIQRENRVLTGAGADRLQSGMAHSYGTAIGRAAFVKQGQEIFLIAVNGEKARRIVTGALKKIKAKLPCHTRTSFDFVK